MTVPMNVEAEEEPVEKEAPMVEDDAPAPDPAPDSPPMVEHEAPSETAG